MAAVTEAVLEHDGEYWKLRFRTSTLKNITLVLLAYNEGDQKAQSSAIKIAEKRLDGEDSMWRER